MVFRKDVPQNKPTKLTQPKKKTDERRGFGFRAPGLGSRVEALGFRV